MSSAFTPKRIRIDIDRYHKMVAAGVLTKNDRIELVEGEMIDMAPIGPKPAAVTARPNRMLVEATGDAAVVFPGGPVDLGGFSEPQPDLVLLKPRMDDYVGQIPEATDILLLIEVSDTTLAFDRGNKK
jgi:hypothetical protein